MSSAKWRLSRPGLNELNTPTHRTEIRAWMTNYNLHFYNNVITYPCPNLKS